MATHAGAQVSSGNGHDTFDEGSGSDQCDESQFDEKVAEWGLEPTKAYIRIARRKKKEVSEATKDKRKYRATRKAAGFVQYVVEVPVDEAAKRTVYAVAQAIVGDEKNTKNIRSIISTVASSPALLKLCQLLSASGVDVSSIVALIERGDLANIDEIHAMSPTLLADLSRLAKSNDDFLSVLDCLARHEGVISDGSAAGLLDAAIAANGCPEVRRFLEVRRQGGLRSRILGWVLGSTQ
jgi:hypothetical protein